MGNRSIILEIIRKISFKCVSIFFVFMLILLEFYAINYQLIEFFIFYNERVFLSNQKFSCIPPQIANENNKLVINWAQF